MDRKALTDAYFGGWIDRDADAVLATLGATGTYQDPGTRGPISGEAFRGYMKGLWSAFPDLTFEIAWLADDCASAQWIMRGTNTGSMFGLPPTGKTAEVRGADFFTFENGHIATVTGYFDPGALPRQLGLDVIVQPRQIGPFTFGISNMVHTGKRVAPAAFSITFLEPAGDESREKVRLGSRDSMIDMLKMEEFIGATTAMAGDRMVTISAWTDPDAPRRVMREGTHSQVMKGFYDGTLARAGYTAVFALHRNNGFMVRCDACGKMTRNPEDGQACGCGATLPLHPTYW